MYEKERIISAGCCITTDIDNNPQLNSIKEIREYFGLTQQALSDYLEVPLRTIENWENPSRKPPKPYLLKLIRFKVTHDPEMLKRIYTDINVDNYD